MQASLHSRSSLAQQLPASSVALFLPSTPPGRLFADASMDGQLLFADSCTTSGDTVLTVLASSSATGGSWTYCNANDGELLWGVEGKWDLHCMRRPAAGQGNIPAARLTLRSWPNARCPTNPAAPAAPPHADGCGTFAGPFKLNVTLQAGQYYFIVAAPYLSYDRPALALNLGSQPPLPPPSPSPRPPPPHPPPPSPSPRPPPPSPPPPHPPLPSPSPPKPRPPPPRPPPPRPRPPPPPPPPAVGQWSSPVVIPNGPGGLPFTSQPISVRGQLSGSELPCPHVLHAEPGPPIALQL